MPHLLPTVLPLPRRRARLAGFSLCLMLGVAVSALLLSGCRDTGFRELDVSAKGRASGQTAREVMQQLQLGLKGFYEARHHYPATTEARLYDSIRNYIPGSLDPIHLFPSESGKGYLVAVGTRSSKFVYRYPPTIGSGDYTLYWVGPNGVDEEGEGDDLDAFAASDSTHRFERQRLVDLSGGHGPERLLITRTGQDLFRDSVSFVVLRHDTILYRDSWPVRAYFQSRPELTDLERRRMVRTELDHFLTTAAFVRTDSLQEHDWLHWADVTPGSAEMAELTHSGGLMFNYYSGVNGSRGIAWLPSRHAFVVVWHS